VISLRVSIDNQQTSTLTRIPHIDLDDVQSNIENDSMESESSLSLHSVSSVQSKSIKNL